MAPFLQHCHQKIDPIVIRTRSRPPGHSKICLSHQCLYLQQNRSCPFQRTSHHRPGGLLRPSAKQVFRRVLHLLKSLFLHLKNTDFVGRAKAVFHSPENPVGGIALPLKIQHSVYHVLQYPGTGYHPFLRHMSDYKYGYPHTFGNLQKNIGGLPYLADTSRS